MTWCDWFALPVGILVIGGGFTVVVLVGVGLEWLYDNAWRVVPDFIQSIGRIIFGVFVGLVGIIMVLVFGRALYDIGHDILSALGWCS